MDAPQRASAALGAASPHAVQYRYCRLPDCSEEPATFNCNQFKLKRLCHNAGADALSKRDFKSYSKFWIAPPGDAATAMWHWNKQQKLARERKPNTPPAR